MTHCAARTHSAATNTRALATKNQARVSPTVACNGVPKNSSANSALPLFLCVAEDASPKTLATVAASALKMGGAARTVPLSTHGRRARRFASAQKKHSRSARPTYGPESAVAAVTQLGASRAARHRASAWKVSLEARRSGAGFTVRNVISAITSEGRVFSRRVRASRRRAAKNAGQGGRDSPPGRRVSKVVTAERVKLSRVAPEGKDARAPHASTATKATSAMTASASATRRAGWACREWVCSLEDLGSGVSEEEKSDEEAKHAGDLEAWPAFTRANAPEAPPPRSTRVRDKRCA